MAGEQAQQQQPAIDPADYDIDASRTDLQTPAAGTEKPAQERNPDGTFKSPEPEAPVHPGYLVELARDFGFTDDEINGMPTDLLGRNVQILRQREAQRQRTLSAEYQLQNPRVPQPAPAPPQPEPEIDLGIDEAEFGPEIVKVLKKVKGDSIKEARALREELAQVKAQQAQVQQTATANHLDAAFDLVGDEFKHIYGVGSAGEIGQSDPDSVTRRVSDIKALMAKGINPFAMSPKALAGKIKQYAAPLYKVTAPAKPVVDPYADAGVPTPTNGKTKPRISQEEWDNAGLAKPTSRKGAAEPDGTEKAIRNLEAKQRELGVSGSVPNQSELEGFL